MFEILDTMHPLLFWSIWAYLIFSIIIIIVTSYSIETKILVPIILGLLWFVGFLNFCTVSKSSILLEPLHIIRTNSQIIVITDENIVNSENVMLYNSKDSELRIKQTIYKNVYNRRISTVQSLVKYSYENLEPIEASNE